MDRRASAVHSSGEVEVLREHLLLSAARGEVLAHRGLPARGDLGAGEEAHLVQWLSRRLGTELEAPDLTGLGLRLMGGRLLPAGTGPAAMLMYDDDAGTRLTLYVKADEAAQTAFEFAEEDSYSAFYWRDGGLGYAITGDIGRDTLLKVAQAVYHQLDPAPLHEDSPPVSDQAR